LEKRREELPPKIERSSSRSRRRQTQGSALPYSVTYRLVLLLAQARPLLAAPQFQACCLQTSPQLSSPYHYSSVHESQAGCTALPGTSGGCTRFVRRCCDLFGLMNSVIIRNGQVRGKLPGQVCCRVLQSAAELCIFRNAFANILGPKMRIPPSSSKLPSHPR
jgi:hypothetical protein